MSETKPIRMLLVDDHAVVRRGLGAFLLAFDDLELVGEASSGAEALRLCDQVQPDVVLMDLVMPEMPADTGHRPDQLCRADERRLSPDPRDPALNCGLGIADCGTKNIRIPQLK